MTASLAQHSHQRRRSEARFPNVHGAEAIAAIAVRCLLRELETWPKPGLVSHVDSGSHSDMNFGTFQRSAAAIKPHLHALAEAGAKGCGIRRLRIIGLEAEAAMFAATGGVNTHKGAIFGLGLLCAAAGAKAVGLADPTMSLGDVVVRLWSRNILYGPVPLHSHGGKARRYYGAGGARAEAARGFPSVYAVGLPALRWGALIAPGDPEAARVQACFALISAASAFLDDGGVGRRNWRERASVVHQSFIARRLSPGGSADLLAMSLFIQASEAEFQSCRM
jgi:triphosphoribosyl-dephospho-CoA synthase